MAAYSGVPGAQAPGCVSPRGASPSGSVYVVILNWNGWADTVECLESVFRSDFLRFRVIVCDNDSSDGSLDKVKLWARGLLDAWTPPGSTLRPLAWPPLDKPVPYLELHQGDPGSEAACAAAGVPLVLIQTGANLGFAGGNNVGLRHALACPDCDYVWLLNNDTVVAPAALGSLVRCAALNRDAAVGLVGSKLLYYHDPGVIQGIGGVYNRLLATSSHVGAGIRDDGRYDSEQAQGLIDYPIGASLLVSRHFLDQVGPLCEEYFLYFEELDWVLRARRKGWGFRYCWHSLVYHKEGASIGGSSREELKSPSADYWALRNRLLFTRKFYPRFLATVQLGFLAVIANRIRRRQFDRLPMIFSLLLLKSHDD